MDLFVIVVTFSNVHFQIDDGTLLTGSGEILQESDNDQQSLSFARSKTPTPLLMQQDDSVSYSVMSSHLFSKTKNRNIDIDVGCRFDILTLFLSTAVC